MDPSGVEPSAMPEKPPASSPPPSGPIPTPSGVELLAATPRTLTVRSPRDLPAGRLLEFELLLGARPLEVTARVKACQGEPGGTHVAELELMALAQVDRDSLTDFLQAVGADALRVRTRPQE